MENYGQELILDLHDCDPDTFTRESIGHYFRILCKLIDMKAEDCYFWDDEGLPPEKCQTNPKTCGVSAVQFILTSSIVVHALTKLRKVFINIFSCKYFDTNAAREFTKIHFRSKKCYTTCVGRR